jgi:hypothetical protein
LTPHIVKEPSQLAGLSANERGEAQLAPRAFSEEELNRFLGKVPVKDPNTIGDQAPAKGDSKSKKKH